MSEYKRMISYMYRYKQGDKLDNVGYARIESRNNECRFTLHIKTTNQLTGALPTYLIHRNDEGLELIELGSSGVQNFLINSRYFVTEKNILNSNIDLSDICGMLLYKDEELYYGTQWDSQPILLGEIKRAMRRLENKKNKADARNKELKASEVEKVEIEQKEEVKAEEEKIVIEEVEKVEAENIVVEEETIDTAVEEQEVLEQEVSQKEVLVEEVEESPTDVEIASNEADVDSEVEQENIEGASIPKTELNDFKENCEAFDFRRRDEESRRRDEEPEYLRRIFSSKEKTKVFDDEKIIVCVKIEPKDIESFPDKLQGIMNNSFLLHGYYNYKHIIIAKAEDNGNIKYILGVPGNFHNREKFMARMFGFEYFKPVKRGNALRQGDFGYWFIYIDDN